MASPATNRPWTYLPGRGAVEGGDALCAVALDVRFDAEVAHHAMLLAQPAIVVGLADDQGAVLAHEARVELPRQRELQLHAAALDPQQVARHLAVETAREVGVAAVVGRQHHLGVVGEHRPRRARQVHVAALADPLRLEHEEVLDPRARQVQRGAQARETAADDQYLQVRGHGIDGDPGVVPLFTRVRSATG